VGKQRPRGSERRGGGGGTGWRRTWMESKIKVKGLFAYLYDERRSMNLSGTT
jgi:hypothetical protein